jgi:hypothetical protein
MSTPATAGYNTFMTTEDLRQELEREPFVPLRLHLASGKTIDVEYDNSAFVRQNTVLIVHRLAPGSAAIGNYEVVALRLIERIEQLADDNTGARAG